MTWREDIRHALRRGDWREDVSAYLDGELSPGERARVEARLTQSAEMRAYRDDLEKIGTVLQGFQPPPADVFELTPEMLRATERVSVRAASPSRGMRFSMSAAAVGIATFAALMVFDAIDTPAVNFSSTSAQVVPTVIVTTAPVAQEAESVSQADSDSSAEPAPAAFSAGDDSGEAQSVQPSPEASALSAEQPQDAATNDPSRQAVTASQGATADSDGEAVSVSADEVVQQSAADEDASTSTTDSEPLALADQSGRAALPDNEQSESAQNAQSAETTRSVATSVTQAESSWPLEQRPRSDSVQLAGDPSWEQPVQIVLGAIAVTATMLWLALTIADRRRRA